MDHRYDFRQACLNDGRSDEELIRIISSHLTDPEDEKYWEAVRILHGRFNQAVFAQAQEWSLRADPNLRRAAADLIAQGHVGNAEFEKPAGELLVEMLKRENHPHVLHSLAVALGHNGHAGRIPLLVNLRRHEDDQVRYGVAVGLAGCDEPSAVRTLIELTRDADSEVRDWATFALGSQTELDQPAIREALWSRASDSDQDTQGEAIVGLAVRKDARVIPLINQQLRQPQVSYFIIEAAKEFPQPQFLDSLRQIRERNDVSTDWRVALVNEAIQACEAQPEL